LAEKISNVTSINLTRSEQRDISIGEACDVSIGGLH
jgi:hypothetical protein